MLASLNYWQSIYILTKAALVRVNRHSILGSFWALVQPFVHMSIIAYIFSTLLKQPPEIMIKNLAVGVPMWSFLCVSLINSTQSLMMREQIIKKCNISKTMFIIADFNVGLISLVNSMLAMYILLIILYLDSLSPIILLSPILLLPFIISILAVCMVAAYLTPYIRDIPQVIQLLTNTLYWTVPIIYPYSMIPESKRIFFEFHPIFLLMRPVQVMMVEQRFPDMIYIIKSLLVMTIVVISSYLIYRKLSRNVVYYL